MKYFILIALIVSTLCLLSGCEGQQEDRKLIFATSAEYPPFEYKVGGILTGFEIELGMMIAEELGWKIEFKDMQFSSVLPAVQSGIADAGISTITITEKRKKNFDFSIPYYVNNMAIIFHKERPIEGESDFISKKIACQLGTTMEMWLKENAKGAKIITTDNNIQAIEALKVGYVDGVLIDTMQAAGFMEKNPQLIFKEIGSADSGYAIIFRKGSVIKNQVNQALKILEKNGTIEKLKKKYLEVK